MSHAQLLEVIAAMENTIASFTTTPGKATEVHLIREIHHRIKNNLQGIAGLLRQHANEHPEILPIINQAIAQVRTIAIIYGLQGQSFTNEVVLCELVPSITRMVQSLLPPDTRVDISIRVPRPIRVTEQESVPIALILNELIMNAAKHAQCTGGAAQITIRVEWDPQQSRAFIRLTNPGSLPPGFDFERGSGCGIGLELVRSLMPPAGSTLVIGNGEQQVEVLLTLFAPSIYEVSTDKPQSI